MAWYLYRLTPHRADFATTMSAEERAAMLRHVEYWRGHLEAGRLLIFAPVADPTHSWGLGIVRADDEEELAALKSDDPAILAGFADADWLLLPGAIVAGR